MKYDIVLIVNGEPKMFDNLKVQDVANVIRVEQPDSIELIQESWSSMLRMEPKKVKRKPRLKLLRGE